MKTALEFATRQPLTQQEETLRSGKLSSALLSPAIGEIFESFDALASLLVGFRDLCAEEVLS